MTADGARSVLNLAQGGDSSPALRFYCAFKKHLFLLSKAAFLPAPFLPGVGIFSLPAHGLCDPFPGLCGPGSNTENSLNMDFPKHFNQR